MEIVGLIAEYNPFHNGHAYQLAEIKKRLPDAEILVIMSGNFVQRGEPAVQEKFARAQAALEAGADLVLELPPAYACGAAPNFARGAVRSLLACGCVTHLAFGAECSEIERLQEASVFLRENMTLSEGIKARLRSGLSYPKALGAALHELRPDIAKLLETPNNLLAVEYLKCLQEEGSDAVPLLIPRVGSYHDGSLEQTFASAGAIRGALREGRDGYDGKMPHPERLREFPVFPDDLSEALSSTLLRMTKEDYCAFEDVSPEMAARIDALRPFLLSFEELTEKVSTRAYSAARVRRGLLHILLNICNGEGTEPPQALRILGLRPNASLPALLKNRATLPVITKFAAAPDEITTPYRRAGECYAQLVFKRHGARLPQECQRSPLVYRS